MASQTLNFNALADTYTARQYPTTNYNSASYLIAGASYQSANLLNRGVFVAFDISSIPSNDVIKTMKLRLYLLNIVLADGSTSARDGYSHDPNPSSIVVRGRRVTGYTTAEFPIMTFNSVNAKSGLDNIYAVNMDTGDSSLMLNYKEGSYVDINITNVTKTSDGLAVIAVLRDDNYLNDWSKMCGCVFYSKEGSTTYAPKLIVTTEDYVPEKPNNLTPNNSARNRAGDIKLSWVFSDSLMNTTQASYQLQYSTDNFATNTQVTGTTNSYHTITSNTFTNGATVKWKVRITDSNGDTTDWSDIASFTIGATLPSAPEILSPINTIVNSSDIIVFRWKFTDTYGYTQSKFDFQYKLEDGAATTVTNTSTVNQYSMPATTLLGGDYSWRIRCYNAFNEVGPYSEWAPFYSIGKPALPIITNISNSMHPIITWTAEEQNLFIIKIYQGSTVIYNSGEQISNGTYTTPDFIDNGTYKLGLQVSNIYGFWSSEQVANFTISATKPTKPTLICNAGDLFTALYIEADTIVKVIYRKGSKDKAFKLIGSTDSNSYVDYSAPAGESLYFVRALLTDGYEDSDTVSSNIIFNGVVLSGYDNQSDLINLYQTKDSDKRKNISLARVQYKVYCTGRQYPVLQSTENKSQGEGHEYFIKDNDLDAFTRIVNDYNTLLYRNNYGYSYKAEISSVGLQEDTFGYIVSFVLTRLEE